MEQNSGKTVAAGWWSRRRLLVVVLVILLATVAWWTWRSHRDSGGNMPPAIADKRILSEGIIYPARYAQMVMPVDGMVGEILVGEGEKVKTGQPLIRLVRQDYQARVNSARSDVARAAAAVEVARVSLSDAQREYDRQKRLQAAGAVSRQQLDQAGTTLERNRAALTQAEAELLTQESKKTEAEGLLDKTELRAPMDGTVAFLEVKVGEHALLGTVLVRIADESAWVIRSDDLTELAIARVRVGNPTVLTFDGIPGLEIAGKVKTIRPYGEKKRGDITYTVTIEPESWDERLRWMMTAQIAISP